MSDKPPRRHANVVNADELDAWSPPKAGPPPFKAAVRRLGSSAGAKHLGCNLFEVPAGAAAVPMHAHLANEEAIYLLEGHGTLRIGDARVAVRPGDWVSFPPGPGNAHQLVADRGEALRYLCVSTMIETEVVTYPDSKKLLAASGNAPGASFRMMFRQADGGVDYFEGEGER